MSPTSTLVDARGYVFKFPTLGLPDVAGEWHIIQVGIALKPAATPEFFHDTSAPSLTRRFASEGCSITEVEHRGAVWIVPLVPPQKADPETERFVVKARRERLASMQPKSRRRKVADDVDIFMPANPISDVKVDKAAKNAARGSSSKAPTEADETAFWEQTLSTRLKPHFDPKSPLFASSSVIASLSHPDEDLDTAERLTGFEWLENPSNLLTQSWMKEQISKAIDAARRNTVPIASVGPGLACRVSEYGEAVRLDYAVTVDEKFKPREDEWKTVPRHAFKPGAELRLVNQTRQKWGQGPITQVELERQRGL